MINLKKKRKECNIFVMARKTIFDIYNEQHTNEQLNTIPVGSTKEVESTPTEEVQPEKINVQPEVQNTQPITTPLSDKGATSLTNDERGDLIGNGNNPA